MDINDQINEALEAAAEYRQAAEERPDLAHEMLAVARKKDMEARELMRQRETIQPGDALAAWEAWLIVDEAAHKGMADAREDERAEVAAASDIVRRHLTANQPCPHVRTSGGGTSYCTLAESASAAPTKGD